MSALPHTQKHRSPVEIISTWWQEWTRSGSGSSELACCAEDEVDRIARDMGMSARELRQLAQHGPHSADLLLRRMAALDLDPKEVSQTEPQTFQDLQRVCTLCDSRKQCTKDMARDMNDPAWEDYCPNVATLKMLNALPWAARREW
jgi:hypothetical protein